MNLDVNGIGEGMGDGRVAMGGKLSGGKAIVIHKIYFGNVYLLNKS